MKKILFSIVIALLVAGNSLQAQDVDEELKIEEDGFRWVKLTKRDNVAYNKGKLRYIAGAKDRNGKVIIPLSRDYDYVFYSNEDDEGFPPFFSVKKGSLYGACTIDGRVIVAPMYGFVEYDLDSDVFVFKEYAIDPNYGGPQYQVENLFMNAYSNKPYYSLGVSLNRYGEPYMSNKTIVSYSEYYTPYSPPANSNSNKGSYSSNTTSAPILNGDNLATGIVTVLAGAFIVAGIYDLFGGSSKTGSSSNSSNSNTVASNSENVMSKGNVIISRADLYEHNILTGKFDHIVMYLRNDNSKDVFVNVEMKVNGTWKPCRITYEDAARTETLNGSYGDNGSTEIHLRGNATRVVEVTSYSTRRPSAVRITRVY